MGYRNYIGRISKEEYEKIKDFSFEELCEYKKEDLYDACIGVYDIVNESLYELGKYVDSFDETFFQSFFTNEEHQKYYTNEHDFYIVGPEFLKEVIKTYRIKIKNYYISMVKPFFDERGTPTNFLNTVVTDYSDNLERQHKFDFNEITLEQQTALFNIFEHIRTMGYEWGVNYIKNNVPYNLESRPDITSTTKYEYAIFELVRIYKTFDWENDLLIYYGW